jgi:PadR family transcriptional regulator PadR
MEERAISSDLIRGHIETIILNTLIDGDKYAQLISETVEFESGGKYILNQATLYSSLKRLESTNFVKAYWYDAQEGRRKYFAITHDGRKLVEENLSQWAFSKGIIDKLIGAQDNYTPIYSSEQSPVVSSKFIENSAPSNANELIDNQVQNIEIKEEKIENYSTIELTNSENVENSNTENVQMTVEESLEEKPVDFRLLLNNLFDNNVQTSSVNTAVENNVAFDTVESEIKEEKTETNKIAFKDTVSANINHEHVKNCGIINYDDLSLKAAKEGFKIRFSSKDSAKSSGTLLINKVNFSAMFVMFLVCMIEFALLFTSIGTKLQVELVTKIVLGSIPLILIVISTIIYRINPRKTVAKTIRADSILNTAIIIFNVLLITFAAGMIANVNYHNPTSFFWFAAIPCGLCFNVLIFFISRFFIAHNNKYSHKKIEN